MAKFKYCHYDEGHDKIDAEEFGWCAKCQIAECEKSLLNRHKKRVICPECGHEILL